MNKEFLKAIHNFEIESMTFLHNNVGKTHDRKYVDIVKTSVKIEGYNIIFEYLDEGRIPRTLKYNYFDYMIRNNINEQPFKSQ